MNLKTFRARTMSQALALVRKHLGHDAVILHTRTYKQGGWFGLGAKPVVEITAGSGKEVGRLRRQRAQAAQAKAVKAGLARSAPRAVTPPAKPAQDDWSSQPSAGDLIRKTYAAAQAQLKVQAPGTPASPVAVSTSDVNGVQASAAPAQVEQLSNEMASIKQLVTRMLQQQRTQQSGRKRKRQLPGKLFDQYMAMLQQEMAEELADEVVESVIDELSPEDLEDDECVAAAVRDRVAAYIPGDEQAWAFTAPKDGRPLTIALVGPTGVGKTTTIAKLAANFKLRQKRKVGLITLDTYRIAAVEQLRTYADIIGVRLHVASNVDELLQALNECRGCDVVLMDTAGRSQRDDAKLDQLRSFLQAADPHETHLVLSSTCTQQVLLDSAARFGKIRTDRIIFTKLDEAVSFGVMVNVARKVNKRLSFVTTGQEVPHHIEPGKPQRLAALVMGKSSLEHCWTDADRPAPVSGGGGR